MQGTVLSHTRSSTMSALAAPSSSFQLQISPPTSKSDSPSTCSSGSPDTPISTLSASAAPSSIPTPTGTPALTPSVSVSALAAAASAADSTPGAKPLKRGPQTFAEIGILPERKGQTVYPNVISRLPGQGRTRAPDRLMTAAPNPSRPMTDDAPNRSQRQRCWDARDRFFTCLDRHRIDDALNASAEATAACGKEELAFEKDCVGSWVEYFKKKRAMEISREKMLREAETKGGVVLPGVPRRDV